MNSIIISEYFKNYNLLSKKEDIKNLIIKKNIRLDKNIKINLEVDRTICTMLRIVNLFTEYFYEKEITIILDFANSATLKLSDYKNARKNWLNYIENDNRTNWKRSKFDDSKKEISSNIMNNLDVKPFSLIKNLQKNIINNINNNENKEIIINLLYEINYYIYRLNEKLFEYENIK